MVATNKVLAQQPYLCFFQGGPGFECPNPSERISWLSSAVKHFRVILLDQRGTGRSTPVHASSLEAIGTVDQQVMHCILCIDRSHLSQLGSRLASSNFAVVQCFTCKARTRKGD